MDEPPYAPADPLLTVEDVACVLNMNEQTVRNYIDAGTLPAVRVGGRRVRIRESALKAFLAASESGTATTQRGEPAEVAAESPAALRSADRLELDALAALDRLAALGEDARKLADDLRDSAADETPPAE
jgi:excisionase family DNA binding protein